MQNPIFVIFLCIFVSISVSAQDVYLNEIRANDASTDDAEFIEVIGVAGTDVSGYTIEHFNGNGGASVFSFTFPSETSIPDDGYLDDLGRPIGFLVIKNTNHAVANFDFEWGTAGLQNGPDGLEFRDDTGTRIQALTWGGLGDLSGGTPAWRDVGSDDAGDNGLSAPDGVQEILQNVWSSEVATPGDINVNQFSGDISLPVELSSFTAVGGDAQVSLKWVTQSEINNQGFVLKRAHEKLGNYQQIASYENEVALRGAGNTSSQQVYKYVDKGLLINGQTYWYKLIDVDVNGVRTAHPVISAVPHVSSADLDIIDNDGIPQEFALKGNYPNPFNPETTIHFDIPQTNSELVQVKLTVYNMLGQKIVTLINEPLAANAYRVKWMGIDEAGRQVPSGIYFYVFNSPEYINSGKMMLIK